MVNEIICDTVHNKYFVNVASELAPKIPKSKTDLTKTIKTNPVSICLENVCKESPKRYF